MTQQELVEIVDHLVGDEPAAVGLGRILGVHKSIARRYLSGQWEVPIPFANKLLLKDFFWQQQNP